MSKPQDIFTKLGIDSDNLGCARLGVEYNEFTLPEEWLYYHPDLHDGGGLVSNANRHVTLRYGITDPAVTKEDVDFLLSFIAEPPAELLVKGINTFQYPEFDVLKLDVATETNQWLYDASNLLGMLPGVNTFPDYVPHVTLAYIKKGYPILGENYPEWVFTRDVTYSGVDSEVLVG
jgi:2'-5' RNA ligase